MSANSEAELAKLSDAELRPLADAEYRRAATALGIPLSEVTSEEHHEVMRMAWDSSPALREEMGRAARQAEIENARIIRERAAIRRAFLEEKLSALKAEQRPTKEEEEDLARRLLAALEDGDGRPLNVPGMLRDWGEVPLFRYEVERALGASLEGMQGEVGPEERGTSLGVILPPEAHAALQRTPYHRIELALVWPFVWHEWRSANAAILASRRVAAVKTKKEGAQGYLSELVNERLREARGVIREERVGPHVAHHLADDTRDGMLSIDADAADFLAGFSREAAEKFRRARRRSWEASKRAPELDFGKANQPPPVWLFWADWLSFAIALADALWGFQGEKGLKQLKKQITPAMPRGVLGAAREGLLTGGRKLEAREVEPEQLSFRVLRGGREVGLIPHDEIAKFQRERRLNVAAVDASLLPRLTETQSLLAQKLFRYLLIQGFRQKEVLNLADFRSVEIEGGLAGLARELGERPGKASDRLRRILDLFQLTRIHLPGGGHDHLLSWSLKKRGKHRIVQIVLMDPMLPGYSAEMPKATRSQRGARILVPIPASLPPFFGGPTLKAPQALMQLNVLEEMATRSEELLDHKGVRLGAKEWRQITEKSELPEEHLADVLAAWVRGDDEAPPFLSRDGDFFALTDHYEAEKELILQNAKKIREGRERWKRGQRRKGSQTQ